MNKPQGHIIVIGRQYAAGGRALGHLLSARLNIPYYDKELLSHAADELGLRPDLFERSDERRRSKLISMVGASYGASTYFTDGALHEGNLYRLQSDVIRQLLERGPCVVVGRTADYIGRDLPNLLSIFLHAHTPVRLDRAMKRHHFNSTREAEDWITRRDNIRKDYYNYYTGRRWGHAPNYDLCLDTSALNPEQAADIVQLFLKHLT